MLVCFVEEINAMVLFNHTYHGYAMEKVTDTAQSKFQPCLLGLLFSSIPNHSFNGLFG